MLMKKLNPTEVTNWKFEKSSVKIIKVFPLSCVAKLKLELPSFLEPGPMDQG